jgi:hypothetical protein
MVLGQFTQDNSGSFVIRPPKFAARAGRILSGAIILFLLQDALIKVFNLDFAVEATVDLGYSADLVVPIGLTLLACTVLYAVPRTAVIGAILLTGYLGGAVATSVRLEEGVWFLFPAAFAVLVWLGLYLRDRRVRALLDT